MEEMEKINNIEEKEINEDNLSDVAGGANRRPRSIYTNFLHTDNNPDNEGDILIALKNTNDFPVSFMAGSRVMQGIFEIHGITSDDNADGARTGGIGSTDERTD